MSLFDNSVARGARAAAAVAVIFLYLGGCNVAGPSDDENAPVSLGASANQKTPAAPPAGPAVSGTRYRVWDNGTRCFQAPCPSWSAIDSDSAVTKHSGLDLGAVVKANEDRGLLLAELGRGAWIVEGAPKSGDEPTVFVVTTLIEKTDTNEDH